MSDYEWADDYSPREQLEADSATETDVQALRREVAELRQLVSETPDPGSEVAVQDNRRTIQEKAARQAKAIEAAEDPATLAELRSLETEEEVMRFLRDNGMNG